MWYLQFLTPASPSLFQRSAIQGTEYPLQDSWPGFQKYWKSNTLSSLQDRLINSHLKIITQYRHFRASHLLSESCLILTTSCMFFVDHRSHKHRLVGCSLTLIRAVYTVHWVITLQRRVILNQNNCSAWPFHMLVFQNCLSLHNYSVPNSAILSYQRFASWYASSLVPPNYYRINCSLAIVIKGN